MFRSKLPMRCAAGYLPAVTTPSQTVPTPASRRVGLCSGIDIPMITELGERMMCALTARTRTYIFTLLPRRTEIMVSHLFSVFTFAKQYVMRRLEFVISSLR